MRKFIPRLSTKEDRTRSSFKLAAIISALLFGLCILATYSRFDSTTKQYVSDRNENAAKQLTALSSHVSVKNTIYQQSLLAIASLLSAEGVDNMNQAKWNQFVDTMRLPAYIPDIRGLGFARNVSADQVADYEQERRDAGFTDYTVTPPSSRDIYSLITYSRIFGPGASPAYGADILADPVRRAAAERSRDTGDPAISEATLLRGNTPQSPESERLGVILYYPVYAPGTNPATKAERQASVVGYVYTAYRLHNMLQNIDGFNDRTRYTIQDVTDHTARTLYSAGKPKPNDFTYTQRMTLGGRIWQATLYMDSSTYHRVVKPWLRFVAGVIVSLLICMLLFTYLLNRFRKVQSRHEAELQRTKDELLALASHQLRTPATSARQYINILLQNYFGRLNKKQREIAKKAYASNERQLEVIDQVLYVAKADSGQLMLSPERVDLADYARTVAEDFTEQASEKNIGLNLDGLSEPVLCVADKRYLRMIIENLISNALKYSYPDSTVTITAASRRTHAELQVADDGVGIARRDLPRLFQKFSRIQNPLSQKEGGSGLGLFLAQKLAEAHGGTITVSTKPKQGSVFMLQLPSRGSHAKNVVQLTE